jgi:GNAT superfamily N-acetyltransferase
MAFSDFYAGLLADFVRCERTGRQWRKREGGWALEEIPYIPSWDDEKKAWVVSYLARCVEKGGAVTGAFVGGRIVGFSMVEGRLRGNEEHYANLAMLFVSEDFQRRGIGAQLFRAACERARDLGAGRLFISATPKENTVAFYWKMGCRDATESIQEFIDSPDGRLMERDLPL